MAFKAGTTNAKLPLEVGYCSDIEQKCETDELDPSGCIFNCSHWRITPVEFIEKKEYIKELASIRKKNIHELYAFLMSLHEKILYDEFKGKSPVFHSRLKTTSLQIEHEVVSLARFGANPFVGGLIQYEQ